MHCQITICLITILAKIIGFFKKKIQTKNKVLLKNCVRCSEFLTTEKPKATHEFLEHYKEGNNIPFEEKPFDVSKFPIF